MAEPSQASPQRLLSEHYLLLDGVPPVADYVTLRREAGLTPRSADQAERALPGSWTACHVRERASDTVVGMGRVIGDGGWYFHIVDMAVLPAHQRRGIGDAILGRLLARIRTAAPGDAYVSLMADPPGRRLYARHGFREGERSVGMARWLD